MKVYIGNYPNWYSTYNFENWLLEKLHKKYHWDIEEKDYTRLDKTIVWCCDKWQKVLNVTINKLFQKRTVKIRIDKYDTWNMDETLGFIIVPMLKQLKATKHGTPWTDDEDVPVELRSTSAPPLTQEQIDTGSCDDNMEKRWEWILDEMIWAFETHIDDNWDSQFYSGEHDIKWEKDEKTGYSKMMKGPNDTWKVNREGMEADRDRRKNGFRLFGKYYLSLWD